MTGLKPERPAPTVDKGEVSRTAGNPAILELWVAADKLNEAETDPKRGKWVPWRTVLVDEAILPRDGLNRDAVESYANDFDQLPPIKVQKGTYKLIGGRTRLEAVLPAVRDHIRIEEIDAKDEDLWELAFEDNRANGQIMSLKEKTHAAKRCLQAHDDWSNARIGEWAGVHPNSVGNWRKEEQDKKERLKAEARAKKAEAAAAATTSSETPPTGATAAVTAGPGATQAAPPEAPPEAPAPPKTRLGVDGKTYSVGATPPKRQGDDPRRRLAEGFMITVPQLPEPRIDDLVAAIAEDKLADRAVYARRTSERLEEIRGWLDDFAEAVDARINEAKQAASAEGEEAPAVERELASVN